MASAVDRYLEALGAQNWDALEATLAEDVHRTGPYRDVIVGRRAYRDFLADVVSQLDGYLLQVEKVDERDDRVWVLLSETVTDDSGQRMCTEEALLYELDAEGKISRVAVYTQKSEPLPR